MTRTPKPKAEMPGAFWKDPEHVARLAAVTETAQRDGVVAVTLTTTETGLLGNSALTGYRLLRDDATPKVRDTVLAMLDLLAEGSRAERTALTLNSEQVELLSISVTEGYRSIREEMPQADRDVVLAVLNLLDIGRDVLRGKRNEEPEAQRKFDSWMQAALVEHVGASIAEGYTNGADFWELVDSWRRTSNRDEIEFDGPPYPSGRTSHLDPQRVRYSGRSLGDQFPLAVDRAKALCVEMDFPVPPNPSEKEVAS